MKRAVFRSVDHSSGWVRLAAFRKLSKGLAGGSFTAEHGSDDVRNMAGFTWTNADCENNIHDNSILGDMFQMCHLRTLGMME